MSATNKDLKLGLVVMKILLIMTMSLLTTVNTTSTAQANNSTDLYYELPAKVNDFPRNKKKSLEVKHRWNRTINAFTLTAIAGVPLLMSDQGPASNYINPKGARGQKILEQPITWTTFPNRLAWYFSESQGNPYQLPQWLLYPLADEGRLHANTNAMKAWLQVIDNNNSGTPGFDAEKVLQQILQHHPAFGSNDMGNFAPVKIPSMVCPVVNWNQLKDNWIKFIDTNVGGPRGWKDEYNEWVVTRNSEGKITKISFTSENPEYWFILWSVDRTKVRDLYRQLVNPKVEEEDLYLRDEDNNPVYDHFGHPVYNPMNKWNYGFSATDNGGGAVHLTSPPNTVGAEIGIAAAPTILRDLSPKDYSPAANICAGVYGSNFRNSDPNIGIQVSQIVRNVGRPITLANPVALYMQSPDFSTYQTPDNTDPRKFFKIVRGKSAAKGGTRYDQILHATFEVPKDYGYTVSDITINGQPIYWGSQMSETINVALAGVAYAELPVPIAKKQPPSNNIIPINGQAGLLIENAVLDALFSEKNMKLGVNNATLPVLPFEAVKGSHLKDIALQMIMMEQDYDPNPTIYFTREDGTIEANIKVKYKRVTQFSGLTGRGSHQLSFNYLMDIDIAKDVQPGAYGVQVSTTKGVFWVPTPGVLIVID